MGNHFSTYEVDLFKQLRISHTEARWRKKLKKIRIDFGFTLCHIPSVRESPNLKHIQRSHCMIGTEFWIASFGPKCNVFLLEKSYGL